MLINNKSIRLYLKLSEFRIKFLIIIILVINANTAYNQDILSFSDSEKVIFYPPKGFTNGFVNMKFKEFILKHQSPSSKIAGYYIRTNEFQKFLRGEDFNSTDAINFLQPNNSFSSNTKNKSITDIQFMLMKSFTGVHSFIDFKNKTKNTMDEWQKDSVLNKKLKGINYNIDSVTIKPLFDTVINKSSAFIMFSNNIGGNMNNENVILTSVLSCIILKSHNCTFLIYYYLETAKSFSNFLKIKKECINIINSVK